jgi:SAM-dependent methyltransferase
VLQSTDAQQLFANARPLPQGFGIGFDERVIEYPWVLSHLPAGGRVLDAGSTLNHAHVLDAFLPRLEALHILTLTPEAVAFPERSVSYVYGDMRDIPYRDGFFDAIVAISSVEHVGMDNSRYGVRQPRADEPDRALRDAVEELLRVLRPTGTLLMTVPYGRSEDHGWFRQFGRDDAGRLTALFAPRRVHVDVYGYGARGWQRSSLEAATSASYHDHHVDRTTPRDRAAAARAVLCVAIGPR